MAERSVHRKIIRREKAQADRQGLFVADYVKHKYKSIYDEAIQYYAMLRQQNPNKLDLKRTEEYRLWAKHQVQRNPGKKDHDEHPQQKDHDEHPQQKDNDEHPQQKDNDEHPQQKDHGEPCFNDNLQLQIPLLNLVSTQEKPTATVETQTLETLTEEILGEDTVPSLEEELPDKLIKEIIDELKQYPELQNIFTDVEEFDMDIDISDDDRLEEELW